MPPGSRVISTREDFFVSFGFWIFCVIYFALVNAVIGFVNWIFMDDNLMGIPVFVALVYSVIQLKTVQKQI